MTTRKCMARILTLVLSVCLILSLALPVAAADIPAAKGFDEVKYGVFKFNWDFQGESNARGTAFLINEDTIITAGHCVAYGENMLNWAGISGVTEQEIKDQMSYSVTVERDMTVQAELLTYSESMDFAILRLVHPIPTRKYLILRDSKTVKAPEPVFSFGFPAVYDDQKTDNDFTMDQVMVKSGIVTKTQGLAEYWTGDGYHFKGDAIFTDCELQGGDSGGPMVDQNGYVIGVSVSSSEWKDANGNQIAAAYQASAIDQVMRACDNLGIPYYTNDGMSSTTDNEQSGDKENVPETTEAPDVVPNEPTTVEPTSGVVEKDEKNDKKDDKKDADDEEEEEEEAGAIDPLIIILAVVAVAVVAVIVVVVVVLSKGKSKEQQPVAVGGGYIPPAPPVAPPAAPTGTGFTAAPVTPAANTVPMEAGETTVLSQDAGETTVLSRNVNGGSLIRKRNGEKITISSAQFVIGRDRKVVNYCISDNSSISRKHVTLEVRGEVTYLVDLNAANGTFVNGVKALPRQEIALKDGDKITLSDEDFEYKK